ncbi:Small nuclear ribonucleoprotein G [Echinococcus granulosus]|uniref:Small nuclear ribonucleoprotein G n=2 Tax=Echinococcus TaxID=6209 RepID=U6IWR8_ECHGR|nr:Small nuclear ribonucleoprotein G [Echinococcus granulosus]EUB63592.1 Small nuclear ribonucleoprotein G [Echinococcus granulosus]KAH9287133.1 Small nuclear ribonucleoprotein G [Echinococcus granulosus]CDS16242.1 small nuclear ribonucleoprotein G [Echinococcus granulosus]CDS41046.1 small nuclear ribonucleoprotein G [Echinococcus multilocularis]
MSPAHQPDLKKYLDKRVRLKLNGNREVVGVLRGFDPFMNMVLDDCQEISKSGQQINIDTVVVRGNSVNIVEVLERF